MRSRTWSSSLNRTADLSSVRASPLTQTADVETGQVAELIARFAGGEHEPHGLGQQTTGDERESQRRGLIQPLRVIDDTQHRPLLGHLRQQAEHGQGDEEPVRGGAGAQAEHDLQRLALRAGQRAQAGRAAARTADAGRRRPAPSPTRPPPPVRPSDPTPPRSGTPAAPSSRSQPRRAEPRTGSRPGGYRGSTRPAARTRQPARAGPYADPVWGLHSPSAAPQQNQGPTLAQACAPSRSGESATHRQHLS